MKKIILFSILLLTLSFGYTKNQVYTYYKVGAYEKACKSGAVLLSRNKTDDNLLSLVALSCVKADYLNTAINLSKYMINSPMARNNASYIASLFLTKKLLLQFMYDGIDLTNLSLPKSPTMLSVMFEAISHSQYKEKDGKIIIRKGGYIYTLEKLYEDSKHKILMKKLKGPKVVEQHIFW